jgi:hypothetical protein
MIERDSEAGTGKLTENILYFARALRAAGLPVGPGSVIEAVRAVEAAGIGSRADFRAVLHAVLVKKHEQTIIFDQAFDIFWRKRGLIEQLIAMMSPVTGQQNAAQKPPAGAARIASALFKPAPEVASQIAPEFDARFTTSSQEVLQKKDFAQMSAVEIAAAEAAVAELKLRDDEIPTRRFIADPHGLMVDPRRTFRRSMRAGGAGIDIAWRARSVRRPPIVAICDISGSMSDYTRIFLHFLHALTAARQRVQTFLFGTRLTNVTRALRTKDVDEALAQCSASVEDWSGGTRIATSLHLFNRQWSRRVLGQGATVLLFTDGLERPELGIDGANLAVEMERLRKSCRRLIWVNPLLRYDRFEAKAEGIRTMLPFVDEFRPVHNLASIAVLCQALSGREGGRDIDPRLWLKRAA